LGFCQFLEYQAPRKNPKPPLKNIDKQALAHTTVFFKVYLFNLEVMRDFLGHQQWSQLCVACVKRGHLFGPVQTFTELV